MSNIIGILIAVIAFGFVIFVHELGHFMTAKWAGVWVKEFAIGMGPSLFKKKIGETEYAIKLLPLGGYVLMGDEAEECPPGFIPYKGASVPKRAIIMSAGAVMNFLFGFLLTLIFIMFLVPANTPSYYTTTVDYFGSTATTSDQLMQGDKILKVGRHKVSYYEEIRYRIKWDKDGMVDLLVQRDGENLYLEGVKFPQQILVGKIAATLPDFMTTEDSAGFLRKLDMSWLTTKGLVVDIWKSLTSLVVGDIGTDQLSGPVGITKQITDMSTSENRSNTILFIASISLNLGIFNLLPLPILDGSKLLLLGVEAIRKKPVSENVEMAISLAGLVLFGMLFLFATYNDLSKLLGGLFS